jgi:sensor histidine kinase YesM
MKIFRKLYPFFLAVVSFNIIRLVTDIPNHSTFWHGGISENWKGIIFLTLIYYLFDFLVRMSIKKRWFVRKNRFDVVKEYATIILQQLVFGNLLLYLSKETGILYFGNPLSDFIIANAVSIPILTLYYTVLNREKIEDEYREQASQLEKTRSNQLETELKYLRAQYHPHFLFNALNTIYFRIDDQNKDAKNTVELLSELLRYQLYNMEEKADISKEINFVKTYIQFQQLRMTKRLAINTYYDDSLNKQKIYPLIYQPFLENAFKYVGGAYRINIEMKLSDNQIVFKIENSLPEQMPETKKTASGIGIENIKRRLALLYPDRHQLNIRQEEKSFIVELILMCDV